jgi:hypothetical protein
MCFSAEASFAGGAVITAIGIATLKRVNKPSQILYACIPLIFGIQQISEGLLWYTLPLSNYQGLKTVSAYVFLIAARVIWPVMVPLSILLMEESGKKKKILSVLLSIGIVLGLYYGFCLSFFNVYPEISCYHIQYTTDFPKSIAKIAFLCYIVSTLPPFFISSNKKIHVLGFFMFGSCVVSAIFFTQYLTSVWCFFAALLSGMVYWTLLDTQEVFDLEELPVLEKTYKDREA